MQPKGTYRSRNLLTERRFLRVAERARKITGIHIVSITFDKDTVTIVCNSATTKGVKWTQQIQILDLIEHKGHEKVKRAESDKSKRAFAKNLRKVVTKEFKDPIAGKKLERAIYESPIKVSCNCPAFLYWGFKYLSYKRGYGIYPEHRRPRVRNPHQQGYVCKHLYAVLAIWPLLAKAITRRYEKEDRVDK